MRGELICVVPVMLNAGDIAPCKYEHTNTFLAKLLTE
jgi:hypothetical protein